MIVLHDAGAGSSPWLTSCTSSMSSLWALRQPHQRPQQPLQLLPTHTAHNSRSRIHFFSPPTSVFPITRPGLATSAATTYGSQAHCAPWPYLRLLGASWIYEPWALYNFDLPAPLSTAASRTGFGIAQTMLGKNNFCLHQRVSATRTTTLAVFAAPKFSTAGQVHT